MTDYGKILHPKVTPQSTQAREEQVRNAAGGYVFKLDKWAYLDRFLIMGVEGNTYYTTQQKLVESAAKNTIACIKEDGRAVVRRALQISDAGRAPRNDSALFTLVLCWKHGDKATRETAYNAVPAIARTFDHLTYLVNQRQVMGLGWGRGWRRAVANWYTSKRPDQLAYQMAKYKTRNAWSHHDLAHKAHPQSDNAQFNALMLYAKRGLSFDGEEDIPAILISRDEAMWIGQQTTLSKTEKERRIAKLITEAGLTHEMIPNEVKDSPVVWEALLQNMPITAMLRNLGKMSSIGLLGPLATANKVVVQRLADQELLQRGRVHPLNVLTTLATYRSGAGVLGDLTWKPTPPIVGALENAFYASFAHVTPTGKRILVGVDISMSMNEPLIPARQQGLTIQNRAALISVREAAACLALVIAKTEPEYHIVGFAHSVTELPIHSNSSLGDALRAIESVAIGTSTDCALPMVYATGRNARVTSMGYDARNYYTQGGKRLGVDAFIVITDNETWRGAIHPYQALDQYRQESGNPAALVSWGMTSTGFSIADPTDPGSLDVVGYDTDAPAIVADFIRGEQGNG